MKLGFWYNDYRKGQVKYHGRLYLKTKTFAWVLYRNWVAYQKITKSARQVNSLQNHKIPKLIAKILLFIFFKLQRPVLTERLFGNYDNYANWVTKFELHIKSNHV